MFAGNSKASGKPDKANWMDAAITVGPYVFGVGLLCWISYGIDSFLGINGPLYRTLFVCAAVTLLMAWRVDINQFSMHMFYRNRLVACFLGASNSDRSPSRFTGFDPGDDLPLKDFRWNAPKPYDGPYPVLNASLNLVKGKDLAWQERKAESFVMTPHFCGYDVWLEEQDSPMLMHDRPTTDDRKRGGRPGYGNRDRCCATGERTILGIHRGKGGSRPIYGELVGKGPGHNLQDRP